MYEKYEIWEYVSICRHIVAGIQSSLFSVLLRVVFIYMYFFCLILLVAGNWNNLSGLIQRLSYQVKFDIDLHWVLGLAIENKKGLEKLAHSPQENCKRSWNSYPFQLSSPSWQTFYGYGSSNNQEWDPLSVDRVQWLCPNS